MLVWLCGPHNHSICKCGVVRTRTLPPQFICMLFFNMLKKKFFKSFWKRLKCIAGKLVFFQLWNQSKKCATFYINISVLDINLPGLYLKVFWVVWEKNLNCNLSTELRTRALMHFTRLYPWITICWLQKNDVIKSTYNVRK